MAESVSERAALRAGVWNDPAVPEGQVGLVVIGSSGKRLLRIEMSAEVYSTAWVGWLEKWLQSRDTVLRIVR